MAGEPTLLRLLAGTALVFAAGASVAGALGLGRRLGFMPWGPAFAALAWVLGFSLAVPLLLLSGLAGLPIRPWSVAGLLLVLVLGSWLLVRWLARAAPAEPEPTAAEPRAAAAAEPRWLAIAARAVLLAALALFVWKMAVWPVWGWDHHAMWGVKARRMVVEGRLDLAFLATEEMRDARPDRPLGYSAAPLLLTLGGLPGERAFKLLHLGCGLALLALLREGLLRLRLGTSAAEALTAWAAALPLFWDTEAVGQAEMPLALWAVATTVLLLPAHAYPGARRAAWTAGGVALGFLPWIKQEGLTLAALLALALVVASPREGRSTWWRLRLRELHWLLPPAFALTGASLWVYFTQLPPGVGFTAGDPLARLSERLPEAASLLAYMGRSFLLPDALGFWFAFAAAVAAALWRRSRLALALAAVVAAQVLIYTASTFIVYLPPRAHVDAAFSRILAALMPLGMLVIGATLAPAQETPEPGPEQAAQEVATGPVPAVLP